ncbi:MULTISPECIES: hypothetical protein [unclassified Bradyrhizobium]|uniref:hypothetical protein n=1 Tax=unclassified Bradyrhizobium TaxID=2631580 RepID=UPI002FF3667E
MADSKHNTDEWISLCEARALVMNIYLAPLFSGHWLLERLRTKQIRWRYWGRRVVGLSSPQSTDDGPITGDPAFWQHARIEVFWDESWARLVVKWEYGADIVTKLRHKWWRGVEIFRIELLHADVEALLPKDARPRSSPVRQLSLSDEGKPEPESTAVQNTATWVADEARQLKAAGKIPADIIRARFAKLLADQMNKAARAKRLPPNLRPVTSGYIKLSDWGVWPIDKI